MTFAANPVALAARGQLKVWNPADTKPEGARGNKKAQSALGFSCGPPRLHSSPAQFPSTAPPFHTPPQQRRLQSTRSAGAPLNACWGPEPGGSGSLLRPVTVTFRPRRLRYVGWPQESPGSELGRARVSEVRRKARAGGLPGPDGISTAGPAQASRRGGLGVTRRWKTPDKTGGG